MAFQPTHGRAAAHLALSLAIVCQPLLTAAALAQDSGPTGTMLLPLTPKLDFNKSRPIPEAQPASGVESEQLLPSPGKAADGHVLEAGELSTDVSPSGAPPPKQAGASTSDDAGIADDTMLKGTVQIVADDTEFDQDKNTFLGTGNAVALINGEDSKLEADEILYDQNDQMIDARGNVKILRNGSLTTGSKFRFKVTSDEYLITNPDTEVKGSVITARTAYGIKQGVNFQNGSLTMPNTLYLARNAMWGPLSFRDDVPDKFAHPDGFAPAKQHFVFKARKMVYERYKEDNNLTMFGAQMQFGKFAIPLGKVVCTMSKDSKVTMAVTPMIGNNLMSGGTNFGPRFNTPIGKTGVLSWAPMIQMGGAASNPTSATAGGLGLAGQVSYTNQNMTSHLAWGSVSNLMVADLKYRINKHKKIQLGVNRYLDDGMFGYNRAALRAEAVDNHPISSIPYLSSLNFRTAGGWMQDNPQLLNQSPAYAQLFGNQSNTVKVMRTAFRVSEQITATTSPLFNLGDDKYGIKSYIYGGVAGRAYSTGNFMGLGQLGPVLDMHLNKVRLQGGYTQSQVLGSTPFVFDQYIQGNRSVYASGDVKVAKWVTVGGSIGYNMDQKLAYAKTITAAIGPQDLKLLLSRDMIRGTNRFGFDLLYGAPVPFNKLILKGAPDAGQTGGI